MITAKILTKYILSPFWMRLMFFLLFYFVTRELHYIEFSECMRNNIYPDSEAIKELSENLKKRAQIAETLMDPEYYYKQEPKMTADSIRHYSNTGERRMEILKESKIKEIVTESSAKIDQYVASVEAFKAETEAKAAALKAQNELLMRECLTLHEAEKKGLYKIINSMHEKNNLRIKQTITEFLEPQQPVNENFSNPTEFLLRSESKTEELPLSLRFEKGSNPTINIINNTVVDTPKNEDKNTSWFSWCNIS